MRLALSIVVASASVAAAQPAPRPSCTVNIAHAPDDVREVVETWVRGESHCHGDLEVRIVPTGGGLYLFARDSAGRVRERVVPDAQSAGVLVASWAADDSLDPAAGPPPSVQPAMTAPGLVQPVDVVVSTAPSRSHVMFSLGAMLGDIYGVRAELDTTRYGHFVFGLSLGVSTAQLATTDGPLTMRDMNAMVYAALVYESGRFWIRPQLGAGAITSEFNKFQEGVGMETTGGDSAAMFEAALRVGADLGSWTISAGPILRLYKETWNSSDSGDLLERDGDVSFFFGVGRRL